MTHSEANVIYRQIALSSEVNLRREVERLAAAYAHHRATWALAPAEERREMDPTRTAAHNAFIDACNILSRAMGRSGEDNSWRATLGDDRKVIGDFACHIHCLISLAAR